MNIYRWWYLTALFLEIITLISGFGQRSSIRSKNLEKIWFYYNIYSWWYSQKSWSKIWLIILSLVVNPLLSRLDVAYRLYQYVNILIKKISLPEKLKEIDFKLSNSILTEDKVRRLLKESAEFWWKEAVFEEETKEEDNTLDLSAGDRSREFIIQGNQIYVHSHPNDYQSDFHSTYEYKIEWYKVYRKLLEDRTHHIGKEEYYDVRDWVVLESDIIERYKENDVLSRFGSPEEIIKKLKKDCQRNEVTYFETKYFTLLKSPEAISKENFKKYIRSELERIKLWKTRVQELCDKYKVKIEELPGFPVKTFRFINDEDFKKHHKDFEEKLDVLLKKVKCLKWEIEQGDEIIEKLNWYLDSKG